MAHLHNKFTLEINDDDRRHLVILLGEQSSDDCTRLGLNVDVNDELYNLLVDPGDEID